MGLSYTEVDCLKGSIVITVARTRLADPPPSPHKEGDVSGAISSWVHNGGRWGRGLRRETTLQLRQAPGKGDPLSWNRGMGTAATVSGPTWV